MAITARVLKHVQHNFYIVLKKHMAQTHKPNKHLELNAADRGLSLQACLHSLLSDNPN